MIRFRPATPLLSLALLGACGQGVITPKGTPLAPVFTVRAEATGTLTSTAPVRAALAWTVTSQELLDCLDEVEVDGVLTFSFETEASDQQIAGALQRCLAFSERAHVETASVAVEASFPLALEIPVLGLPDEELLSGGAGARLGLADVVIYEDSDGDAVFDETARGADAFADVVVGTSRAVAEEDTQESFIVYREGDLSPVWKIYRAIYGCADPAPGFSTVTLGVSDEEPYFFCTVDDAAVPVRLRDDIQSLGCAPQGENAGAVRADSVSGIPAGAATACEAVDGYYDVIFSLNADSVCPDIRTLSLVGCDQTSEATCRATFYDLLGDEPAWWPCTFDNGEQTRFFAENGAVVTAGNDVLVTLSMGVGLAQFPLTGLRVEIDLPGGDIASDFDIDVEDNDGNGVINVGDRIVVAEAVDVFNVDSVAGNYPVRVFAGDEPITTNSYSPAVAPPVAPVLLFSGADAAAVITDGVDDLFTVTWEGGDVAGPFAVADLFVSGYLGGELPVGGGGAELVLRTDVNNDGLFGVGDTLLVRERADFPEVRPDVLSSFGNELFGVGVTVPVGFNLTLHAGYVESIVLQ